MNKVVLTIINYESYWLFTDRWFNRLTYFTKQFQAP
jgi:hypothetical protein